MADINLNIEGATTFGNKFPNVFIEGIDVQEYEGRPTTASAKFEVRLNLKFTKPKELTLMDTRSFIKSELSELMLYAYITADSETCDKLEANNLSMKQFHESIGESDPPANIYRYERSIVDLIDEEGATVITNSSFDIEGNEIIEISNITLNFKYDGIEPAAPAIESREKLFFLATVGIDTTDHLDVKEILYNTYFGNITYYHILTRGELASRFYRAYSYENNSPYYGTVLQNINGKFYSTENYTFEDVKNTFLGAIGEYETLRAQDPELNKNISDLEAIIMSVQNKTTMLGEIANYNSTYPNKDQSTLSGQFFNAFVVAFSEVLNTVSAQQQVFQRLFLDTLVTDSRTGLMIGTYTPPPIPEEYDNRLADNTTVKVRGIPASGVVGLFPNLTNSQPGLFLSSDRFMCTRNVIAVKRMFESGEGYFAAGSFADATSISAGGTIPDEFGYEGAPWVEGLIDGSARFRDGSGDYGMPDTQGYGFGEYSELWFELYTKYLGSGDTALSPEQAAALATEEVNYILSQGEWALYRALSGGRYGEAEDLGRSESSVSFDTLGFGLPDPGRSATLTTLGDAAKTLNFIIRADGVFFFDYEAALRTQSAISRVLNLTKVQQYFRMNVPYRHFYFEEVLLERRELGLGEDFTDGSSSNILRCRIYLDFTAKPGGPTDYPAGEYKKVKNDNRFTDPSYGSTAIPELPIPLTSGLEWVGNIDDDAVIDLDYHRYKYLRPYVKYLSGTTTYPHLKIKNFDLSANDASKTLKGYNSLDGFPDSYPIEGKTLDGYRLTCFQFRDFYDDDVAHMNTVSGDHRTEERVESLADLNHNNRSSTVYRARVKMIDRTKTFLSDIHKYCAKVLTDYIAYTEEAREICSFNNLSNTYNDFFVEALDQKYLVSKPWINAAYVAVALSDILFGEGDTLTVDEFDALVLKEVLKIAPASGNLTSTLAFVNTLTTLVNYVSSSTTVSEPAPGNTIVYENAVDTDGDGDPDHGVLYFGNEFDYAAIAPIYGDYFPTTDTAALAALARPAAPMIVIPDVVMFGMKRGVGSSALGSAESYTLRTSGAGEEADLASASDTERRRRDVEGFAGFVGIVGVRELVGEDRAYYGGDFYDRGYRAGSFGMEGTDGITSYVTPGVSTRLITGYTPIQDPFKDNLVRIAFDEIFLPYSNRDWRHILFNPSAGSAASKYISEITTMYGARDMPLIDGLDSNSRLGTIPYVIFFGDRRIDPRFVSGVVDATEGDYAEMSGDVMSDDITAYTMAARLAHEIFARSTVDTSVRKNPSAGRYGYEAKRIASSNTIAGRRDDRTFGQLHYLIKNYYLPEAERRIASEAAGEATARYSAVLIGRNKAEGGYNAVDIKIIKQVRMVLEEMLSRIELAAGTEEVEALYGMQYAVSAEDPLGVRSIDEIMIDHFASSPEILGED